MAVDTLASLLEAIEAGHNSAVVVTMLPQLCPNCMADVDGNVMSERAYPPGRTGAVLVVLFTCCSTPLVVDQNNNKPF